MQTTTNYGLKMPEGTDIVNIQDLNDNSNIIDTKLKELNTSLSDLTYQTAGGTATTITLTMQTLVDGYSKTFIASANNSGAATTINGKALYKPGTTIAPNLAAGKAYTVWYNSASGCFFIKASAEGDAIAANVLAGKKFSNDSDTGITGTMTNNGAVTITPGTTNKVIPAGYHNGSGYVVGDADLISANIKSGANIFGVAGSSAVVDTSNAVLDPQYLLTGYSGYDDGVLKSGTMINRSGENWHQPAVGETVSNANGYGAYLIPPRGFYDGSSWVRSLQPDLIASNILSGKNVFGMIGSAVIGQSASGTSTVAVSKTGAERYDSRGSTTLSLPFTPKVIGIKSAANGSIGAGHIVYLAAGSAVDAAFSTSASGSTNISIGISGSTVSLTFYDSVTGGDPDTLTFQWYAATW